MNAGTGRRDTAVGRRMRAAGVYSALGALTFALASPAAAAPERATAAAPKTVNIELVPNGVFTRTDITLKTGDSVSIKASGRIHFGGGKIAALEPPGIPWGAECRAVARGLALTTPWPAPGLACWSFIGKVGRNGKLFPIGTGTTIRAANPGLLILGVNDNFVNDNTGSWLVTVVVTPRAAAGPVVTPTTVPTTVPATAPAGKKSSSSILYLLVGALLVAIVVLLIVFALRRRDKDEDEPDEPVAVAPHLAAMAAAPLARPNPVAAEAEPVIVAAPLGAAPLPESIDVNIFEVEFSNGLTLRVGYNHFPEGVDLRWRVTQNRVPVAVGMFRTQGGGSTNHFETIPLGVKLEGRDTQPDGADVQFDWTINDVPFRYSVRRDPNC